jgi:hypothetical protein
MHKKSQVSNEFIVLLGVAFLVMLIFMSLIASDISSISFEKEHRSMRDLGFSVQREIMTASDVKDGYERQFRLSDRVNGYDYSISNTDKFITVVSANKGIEQSFLIPSVVGNLTKGMNIIRKSGGVVYIN